MSLIPRRLDVAMRRDCDETDEILARRIGCVGLRRSDLMVEKRLWTGERIFRDVIGPDHLGLWCDVLWVQMNK